METTEKRNPSGYEVGDSAFLVEYSWLGVLTREATVSKVNTSSVYVKPYGGAERRVNNKKSDVLERANRNGHSYLYHSKEYYENELSNSSKKAFESDKKVILDTLNDSGFQAEDGTKVRLAMKELAKALGGKNA